MRARRDVAGAPARRTAAGARALAVALACAVLVACSAQPPAPTPSATPAGPTAVTPSAAVAPGTTGTVDLDGRPYRLHVPATYTTSSRVPLVVGLHGYTSTSSGLDDYLGLTAASDARGFLLALPEGTTDPQGHQFWNAVDHGCCDLSGTHVDDSGYLSHLIAQLTSSYAVSTVVVVGHSNGGFMANRLACDHADQVDAIASIAGPLPYDTSLCHPSRPVRVLHVHGDDDDTVPYQGSAAEMSAGAQQTAQRWAELDGCTVGPTTGPALDLDRATSGAETTPVAYTGCRDGVEVRLWTIHGGRHVPTLTPQFTPDVLDYLLGGA
jgi:polyhydroxybutyrate depolymerase